MNDSNDSADSEHDDFVEVCSSLAQPIGGVTGAVYGAATEALLAPEAATAAAVNPGSAPAIMAGVQASAGMVEETIGGFVTNGWPDSCMLMDDVGSAVAHGAASVVDMATQYADQAQSYISDSLLGHEANDPVSNFDAWADATASTDITDSYPDYEAGYSSPVFDTGLDASAGTGITDSYPDYEASYSSPVFDTGSDASAGTGMTDSYSDYGASDSSSDFDSGADVSASSDSGSGGGE